ncbi:hypothetical protein BD309DRAFT_971302 [Dichomitus squalens]|nr:hypothetical protein BD309DRAFT_971302 [Dichomitus squalens]
MPAVYQDFRAAFALSVLADSNPVPNLDKFKAYFQCLETNKFIVANHVKGMMLMAKLPSNMDPIVVATRRRDKRVKKLDEGRAEVGTKAQDLQKLVFMQTATD